jgi:hypothetical protein
MIGQNKSVEGIDHTVFNDILKKDELAKAKPKTMKRFG